MSNTASSPANTLPRVKINGMSPISPDISAENSPIASPARGRETRTALLQKLRPPPLVHAWDCWIERPASAPATTTTSTLGATTTSTSTSPAPSTESISTPDYKSHLTHLLSITDIRQFWSLFNNLPLSTLPTKQTCALFHHGTKPIWEDPRNTRGGTWSFRVPKTTAAQFFTEVCLLAVGEQLQNAVEEKGRVTFRDGICGVTFTPRNAMVSVVGVWNRDGGNENGIERLLKMVLEGVGIEVRPKEGTYYYKRHDAHDGFVAPTTEQQAPGGKMGEQDKPTAEAGYSEDASTITKIEEDVRQVRKILEELNLPKGGHSGAEA